MFLPELKMKMTEELLERIKQNERWPITFWDIFNCIILIAPLGIIIISLSALRSGIINDVPDLILTAIILMILGIFLTIFVSIRLYQNQHFYCWNIPDLSKEQIDAALKRANFSNVEYDKLGFYICNTNVSMFSWGERITIIVDNNTLLINSRPDGDSHFQPITIFKDRKNIKLIIDEI
jgi:hypothetical protein